MGHSCTRDEGFLCPLVPVSGIRRQVAAEFSISVELALREGTEFCASGILYSLAPRAWSKGSMYWSKKIKREWRECDVEEAFIGHQAKKEC
jgi:hypothetical protein